MIFVQFMITKLQTSQTCDSVKMRILQCLLSSRQNICLKRRSE